MSKKEKLLKRIQSVPKDFTYSEAKTLLASLGFYEDNKGKTSGSRVKFVHKETKINIELHKPHKSGETLKIYQIRDIIGGICESERRKENG